jgi:glutamate-1-semialdehyde aminotransferase
MGTGQKLYQKAKTIIPGGTMLLSKRPEMFLPEKWPSYFSEAKGCEVWDLDGEKYIDMSIMGIGTNTLGYGNDEIDAAVIESINKGNMSTLNCAEEVALAEKLLEITPWADMVRFARTGGEANAIATRIARAASGKTKMAICGYHGWHDWYIAANHNNKDSLASHLIPGLSPLGVPAELQNTVYPFHYNNIDELESLISNHDIGIIKMEAIRNIPPKDDFLVKVRALANKKNIILIFDECTSGFRETFGGVHMKFGIDPDVIIYGKTLGNGYALTAVLGKKEVMEATQKTFISSTFWTERIGPVAALKTLEIMERIRSWDIITEKGKYVQENWRKLASSHGISISVMGLPALSSFIFNSDKAVEYKTLITQEMLKFNILASTNFYSSTAHKQNYLDDYFSKLDNVFSLIAKCESGNEDISELLEGPVCHVGFERLN